MKLFIIGAAAAATLFAALPASAQVVVHTPGANVAVGERHYDRDRHEGWRHHYGWRNHHADCRVVRVKTRLPNGNVIVKTRRTCR